MFSLDDEGAGMFIFDSSTCGGRGKGQRRARGRRKIEYRTEGCYKCGRMGHYARDCRQRKLNFSSGEEGSAWKQEKEIKRLTRF